MVMMPELPEVTDTAKRADLARWVVSLRRAYVAQVGQTTGRLHVQVPDGDAEGSYCCLGIWCVVKLAAGVLQRRNPEAGVQQYTDADAVDLDFADWADGSLPDSARLAGSSDPNLLRFIDRSKEGDYLDDMIAESGYDADYWVSEAADTFSAAALNDDYGLDFSQIADVVVWRYALSVEELAAAEQAPRVPEVEGPAEESAL
jgi:hypothetical protein